MDDILPLHTTALKGAHDTHEQSSDYLVKTLFLEQLPTEVVWQEVLSVRSKRLL